MSSQVERVFGAVVVNEALRRGRGKDNDGSLDGRGRNYGDVYS